MRQVLNVARLLALTPDLQTLLTSIATSATSLLNAERASIFLFDPKTRELWTKVALGAREIRVPCTAGIVGVVFGSNEMLHISDPYSDPRFNREIDKKNNFVTRNLLTMPTRDMGKKPIGVLQVVNRIGGDFNDNDKVMIEMLAEQAGVAIQRHYLMEEVVKGAELKHEMDLAKGVQNAMIPKTPPTIAGLCAAGWSRPASVTGGDAYDLWEMQNGSMGIFLGDASGHGIAPAIVVSQARTLIRSLCEVNTDPTWLLERINSRLAMDLEDGRFVTVFLGMFTGEGLLRWSSAGHGPMLYRKDAQSPFGLLDPLAPPVGILPELPADPTNELQFGKGGILAVMSDGIFESRSAEGKILEIEPVKEYLESVADLSPGEMVEGLKEILKKWQNTDMPVDDQTLVIIKKD